VDRLDRLEFDSTFQLDSSRDHYHDFHFLANDYDYDKCYSHLNWCVL